MSPSRPLDPRLKDEILKEAQNHTTQTELATALGLNYGTYSSRAGHFGIREEVKKLLKKPESKRPDNPDGQSKEAEEAADEEAGREEARR